MIKINESLNVFNADKDDMLFANDTKIQSFKNGTAHISKNKKRSSRLKLSRNVHSNIGGSYSKFFIA